MSDIEISLEQALVTAQQAALAARIFLKDFVSRENMSNTFKIDGSPVTTADTTAQAIILKILRSAFPRIPIVAEEDELETIGANSSTYCWFIDPLDGTKEFIKGSKEFTVNIALTQNGIPVVGVVDIPLWDEQYYAAAGMGSFCKTLSSEKRITVSERSLESARLVISRDHVPPDQERFLQQLRINDSQALGSSIKGCYVASGKADLYVRFAPFWYWDVCAQDCIVRQAGGMCTLLDGSSIIYKHRAETIQGILISNANVHTEVIRQLAEFHRHLP